MEITIYHNPKCGTSRNTLALIRNTGVEPAVIDYISNPPDREVLKDLIAKAALTVRDAIREKGTPFAELGLDSPALSDDELLDAMLAQPILINRPFVVTPNGLRLCRPSELVLDILPSPTTRIATYVLPGAAHVEKSGTFINGKKRLQRFLPSFPVKGHAREDWHILKELLPEAEHTKYYSFYSVFEAMVRETPALAGVTWEGVGDEGTLLELKP